MKSSFFTGPFVKNESFISSIETEIVRAQKERLTEK